MITGVDNVNIPGVDTTLLSLNNVMVSNEFFLLYIETASIQFRTLVQTIYYTH